MIRKSFISSFIAAAAFITPAAASASTGCTNPSINVATSQAIVTVGQEVTYSYGFCYNSQSERYTVQAMQTENGEGASISTAVTPTQVTAMSGLPGEVTGEGHFTPATPGRYKVVVAYYEKGQSVWESEGEALIIAKPAPVVPPVTPEVIPSNPAPVPAPVVSNPPAGPIGTAVPTEAKISLTKRALKSIVPAGQVAPFIMTIKNVSKVTALHVVVCDALPTQTQYIGASKTATFHGASACFTIGNMQAGAQASITIRLSINQGTHGTVTNHATATASNAPSVKAQAKVKVPSAPARKVVAPVTG